MVRALVCTRTSTTQVLGRPGLDNEVGSSVVPVHLVSLSLPPPTLLSCLSSFSCLHPFVLSARTFAQSS